MNNNVEIESISDLLTLTVITCPYCWELVELQVDETLLPSSYVEDCNVCCQPILIHLSLSSSTGTTAQVERENA